MRKATQNILDELNHFFDVYNPENKKVLLALSGGTDSLLLFHLLLLLREQKGIVFAAAHIDHGWREESGYEASILADLCQTAVVSYFSKRLDIHIEQEKGKNENIEDVARQARYHYFNELCENHGFFAVLTGHHADDQLETILKRLLEGSHLWSLGGMEIDSYIFGVRILRPLLHTSKAEINLAIEELHLSPFFDKTNQDCRFLRARMRKYLLPNLKENFGKDFTFPLLRLSEEAKELKKYLDDKIIDHLDHVIAGILGYYVDLTAMSHIRGIALKYFLQHITQREGVIVTHGIIADIMKQIEKNTANKLWAINNVTFYLDRSRFFFTKKKLPLIDDCSPLPLVYGIHKWGPWLVNYVKNGAKEKYGEKEIGWQAAFNGRLQFPVPKKELTLATPGLQMIYGRKVLKKWWNEQKVPSFIKLSLPVIMHEGKIVLEMMSGKEIAMPVDGECVDWLELTLQES